MKIFTRGLFILFVVNDGLHFLIYSSSFVFFYGLSCVVAILRYHVFFTMDHIPALVASTNTQKIFAGSDRKSVV